VFMHKFALTMALVSLLAAGALADEDLTLVDIIDFSFLDSAKVTSVTPVGDFNADGYDDLLIGIYERQSFVYIPVG